MEASPPETLKGSEVGENVYTDPSCLVHPPVKFVKDGFTVTFVIVQFVPFQVQALLSCAAPAESCEAQVPVRFMFIGVSRYAATEIVLYGDATSVQLVRASIFRAGDAVVCSHREMPKRNAGSTSCLVSPGCHVPSQNNGCRCASNLGRKDP